MSPASKHFSDVQLVWLVYRGREFHRVYHLVIHHEIRSEGLNVCALYWRGTCRCALWYIYKRYRSLKVHSALLTEQRTLEHEWTREHYRYARYHIRIIYFQMLCTSFFLTLFSPPINVTQNVASCRIFLTSGSGNKPLNAISLFLVCTTSSLMPF